MLKNKTVAFLGAGSMAEAMISGMVQAEKVPANQIIVTNRSNAERLNELETKYGIKGMKREDLVFEDVDVFILAMKPKDIDVALHSIKTHLQPHQLLLSVLAGISTSYMEDHLAQGQQVIRVMPNTSSMMGESATAMSPGQYTAMDNVMIAKDLLTCIGEVYTIDEEKMDIFTGIAGSGPAYFYYLMEHIERAGAEEGLDPEMARQIGAQTILGAAKMIMEQDETPAQLRENVTSPNGTTAAGLDALAKFGGGEAITQAVKGASKRSKEISSQLQKVVNA
ncbi:pyrroline-5-carboxylate reductase [Metabacillus iocasae]|uniref:Pyrroline-5-carboxylate reductase n=1 Tax=Priestia iocasae TaxID=2291674 RepID=A0ABS2QY92_9BACI|nr:pyrroline-5-carboxylate reductase [Metabacillus iocasae]MBM7703696.1 pyrroline-5-carboxylate reductase [Metabacillus iocasae]